MAALRDSASCSFVMSVLRRLTGERLSVSEPGMEDECAQCRQPYGDHAPDEPWCPNVHAPGCWLKTRFAPEMRSLQKRG